jgi:uncharacterized repeat protein (TIGR03803 family)
MKKLSLLKVACIAFLFCAATAMLSLAQDTLTTLVNFDGRNGSWPYMVLTQGADGNFYGTTYEGGANETCTSGCGTVFKMSPAGTLTILYNFCSQTNCADGREPIGSLVQAADGDFYGTTAGGGTHGWGTVFKITPTGKLTTIYSFCARQNCSDGAEPVAGLVQGRNGNFYGTTEGGGLINLCQNGCGTVFEITPTGRLTTLYNFCIRTNCADGNQPFGGLVLATNGNFYGETTGTIFEITPGGYLTTLFSFDGTDGAFPSGGLIQANNGDFYGVTSGGGSSKYSGCVDDGCGTIFRVTPAGHLTTLYNFCSLPNCTDGDQPYGPLVQATDGNFYGTTSDFDVSNGTIFEITPEGALTTLYSFCSLPNCADGATPTVGLLQATNGIFYGTTSQAGSGKDGTVFTLSTGLGPFVKTQPAFAKEGATIGIFGQGFKSSSVVQFGGVQGTVVKVSGTFLEAKVPAGALTGSVTVTTNGTTLTSNQEFRVLPQVLSFSPPNGSVGTPVTINGVGFTQTTGVGFGDNVPAQFTVNSDTQITAIVPSGAKTGPVGVETKGGTAISSKTFTVN